MPGSEQFAVSERARVRSAVAPMQSDARVSAPQTSQVLAGHTVHLLEQKIDWWLVRSDDGYEGWMHRGYLEPSSGTESSWRLSLGVSVREQSGSNRVLPLGARIPDDDEVASGSTVPDSAMAAAFPRTPHAVVHSAMTYYAGASYQWGGVTEWGCDCSGLVQAVFALHGCRLPRDAHQQALVGPAVGAAMTAMPELLDLISDADLLFFSDRDDRRITHVGIALQGGRMIHSALGRGGVTFENLSAEDDYVQRLRTNFVQARRVL